MLEIIIQDIAPVAPSGMCLKEEFRIRGHCFVTIARQQATLYRNATKYMVIPLGTSSTRAEKLQH